MTYAAELDDRRQEVRRGNANDVVRLWPKAPGIGNVLVTSPTAVLYRPNGSSLGAATVTATTVSSVTRLDVAVDASALELDEGYAAVVTYTYDNTTQIRTVRFDVVREPWDGSDVSLNDLVDEVADIGTLIEAQALAKSATRTVEQEASLLAMKATQDVKGWLRSELAAKGRIYPRLILQREELRNVVSAQAVARAYRAQGGSTDSATRQLATDWQTEAQSRLRALGELDYDADDDGVADQTLAAWGAVRIERTWS